MPTRRTVAQQTAIEWCSLRHFHDSRVVETDAGIENRDDLGPVDLGSHLERAEGLLALVANHGHVPPLLLRGRRVHDGDQLERQRGRLRRFGPDE